MHIWTLLSTIFGGALLLLFFSLLLIVLWHANDGFWQKIKQASVFRSYLFREESIRWGWCTYAVTHTPREWNIYMLYLFSWNDWVNMIYSSYRELKAHLFKPLGKQYSFDNVHPHGPANKISIRAAWLCLGFLNSSICLFKGLWLIIWKGRSNVCGILTK